MASAKSLFPKLGRTAFLLCDVQERFRPLIHHFEHVVKVAEVMINASTVMERPILVTEQYPKVFGSTVSELSSLLRKEDGAGLPNVVGVVPKMRFSMITEETSSILAHDDFVLFGIEAHVCVLQTCLDLLDAGKRVYLPIDGVSSQRPGDREAALRQMQAHGATLTTTESLLFLLLQDAAHPKFKAISKLVIEHNKRGPNPLDRLAQPLA